jgi:predicted enzyme related to lactoylglutathione lyase
MGPLIPQSIVHFEIHVMDIHRAIKFYTQAFGWIIKKVGQMWLILTGRSQFPDGVYIGIDGSFILRQQQDNDSTNPNAFVCVVDIANIDTSLEIIKSAGGIVTEPRRAVPRVGWKAYCKDTEGNIFRILQKDSSVR